MDEKTYTIRVEETYSATYDIVAKSLEEAIKKAGRIADADNTLTNPEHLSSRTCEED